MSIAVISLLLSFVLVMFDPEDVDSAAEDLSRASGLLALNPAVWCLSLLFRSWYFTFDTLNRMVTASGRWKNKGTYPRRGFNRIEYSVYDARIYEVRANGKRRRLPVRRWMADRQDWAALVNILLKHQAERQDSDRQAEPVGEQGKSDQSGRHR